MFRVFCRESNEISQWRAMGSVVVRRLQSAFPMRWQSLKTRCLHSPPPPCLATSVSVPNTLFFSLSAQKAESCNFSCFHLEYKFHLLGCINIVIVLHPLSVHSKNTAGRIQFMTWQSDCTLLFAFLYYLFPHYCIKNKLLIFVCKVPQCLSPSYSIFYTHKFCFHLPSCL